MKRFDDTYKRTFPKREDTLTFRIGDADVCPVRLRKTEGQDGKTVYEATVKGIRIRRTILTFDTALIVRTSLCNTQTCVSEPVRNIQFLTDSIPSDGTTDNHEKRHVVYFKGGQAFETDFQPLVHRFWNGPLHLVSRTGRTSSENMPYFNVYAGEGRGVLYAIGYSGRWETRITADNSAIRAAFGLPDFTFTLDPGETVVLPEMIVMPYETKDLSLDGTFNTFRRFMKAHIMPKGFDKPVIFRAWGTVDEAGHEVRLDNIKKFGLPCDSYGIDAGWYDMDGSGVASKPDWYVTAGDWHPSPDVFPHGIGRLSEQAREHGVNSLWIWFEFERAVSASRMYQARPDLYLTGTNRINNFIDFSNPESRAYILDAVSRVIDETGLDVFRVDYNYPMPAEVFDHNDPAGCRGKTELRYYEGLYLFFGALLAKYPGLVIDTCAGGGRRLDYKMLSYSIPVMCSSDYFTYKYYDPDGIQGHTYGISRLIPFSGDGVGSCSGHTDILFDTYRVRSSMRSAIGLAAPSRPLTETEGAWYRQVCSEAETVSPYMNKDYYPLTGYTIDKRDWLAYEMFDPDTGRGLVAAFRRSGSADAVRTFALKGVRAGKRYSLRDIDGGDMGVYSGKRLMKGLKITADTPRTAKIIFFDEIR